MVAKLNKIVGTEFKKSAVSFLCGIGVLFDTGNLLQELGQE